MGVRVDQGEIDGTDLSGLNVGMVLDIPGNMGRGNWTVGAFIDERASDAAYSGLEDIFSGRARGTTGLFAMLVGNFLGSERAPITFETEGAKRRLTVGKKIIGEVEPIGGADEGKEVMVSNTQYWMGPDVVVAQANRGRVRAFGRVWDFEGRSAEICEIDWHG